ncbi:MAG: hypothetical protein KKE05_01595 [Nanoarchaeota archaeon]|nr:hypothetical protein [Nanoarchaeota archaeon]
MPSETRFADEATKEAYYKLEKGDVSERELFRFIRQAMDNIEKNAFCGIQIQKKQIPRAYTKKYGAANLWKYDLPNAWRLIYTIRAGKAIVISVVLEWMTHKEYERRFDY